MPRYKAIDLGDLPADLVNATLETELEPGHVRLSQLAHKHIAEDHSDDYQICIVQLKNAILAPTYIGQDPKHAGNFVFVKRVSLSDGRGVLVAVGLEPHSTGSYAVRSCYLISPENINQRRAAGRLKIPKARQ